MHQAEIKLRAGRELEAGEGLEIGVIVARDRHRHMHISERMLDGRDDVVGDGDELAGILRLDRVPGAEIAVAEMDAKFDIGRHGRRQAAERRHHLLRRHGDRREEILRLAVIADHLVADVPLDAEIPVRDRPADGLDLAQHRFLVSGLDRVDVIAGAEAADHRHRRRQAYLEAHILWQVAVLARRDEIEIGGAGVARVAEFAETHLGRFHAFGQRQQTEAGILARCAARIGTQERIGEQERILEADPQPARTLLTIGDAGDAAAERPADGLEHVIDAVEADAADEVNAVGRVGHLFLRSLSWVRWRKGSAASARLSSRLRGGTRNAPGRMWRAWAGNINPGQALAVGG